MEYLFSIFFQNLLYSTHEYQVIPAVIIQPVSDDLQLTQTVHVLSYNKCDSIVG